MKTEFETEFGLFDRVVDVESMKEGTICGILILPEIVTYQISFGPDLGTCEFEDWRGEFQIADVNRVAP
jgi:hypothetical protein